MGTTIREIAKEANCSVTTVSLVMSGNANNISEPTRKRVIEIAQRMNYRPNVIAANLATGKSQTIGLIIPDNRNPLFGSILKYAEDCAEQFGYRVITCNSDDCISKDLKHIDTFIDYHVAGVAIVRSNASSEREESQLKERLQTLPIPIVAMDRGISDTDIPTFSVDNRRGGYIATKHLLEMGHCCIGCFAGPLTVSSAQQRLDGYKDALNEYGVQFDSNLVFEGDYKIMNSSKAYDFFTARNVTAVFAHNDMQAFGLYKHLQLAGKSIPNDCSIVGYDNLEFSSIITPSLTSVLYPIEDLARDAIRYLVETIDNRENKQNKTVGLVQYEPKLICRDSVKCVK